MQQSRLTDYEIDSRNVIYEWDKVKLLSCRNKRTNEKIYVKVFDQGFDHGNWTNELAVLNLLCKNPHVNIVKIYDVIKEGNNIFIFIEPCEYELEELFWKKKEFWFNSDEIYDLLGQIVSGYQHLRRHRIILRDLSPKSILIKRINQKIVLKISDFALSKILDSACTMTSTGVPFYQAPETYGKNVEYTDQCDIYSLGLILYQMCYKGQKHAALQNQDDLIRFFDNLKVTPFKCPPNEKIPFELKLLIEKMIVYNPQQRLTWDILDCQPKLQKTFLIFEDQGEQYFIDLQKKIGKGMQGTTYLATNLSNQQQLVAKQISHEETTGEREISIYNRMKGRNHENVIKLFKIIPYKEYTYLILEKCELNLEEYYKMKKGFTYEEIVDIVFQIVNGYCFLKDLQIIHRDLKPENILVNFMQLPRPIIKIIDFGVGKIIGKQILAQTVAGTPIYSAPEVFGNEKNYDFQCDIYSLGVLLHYITFGSHYVKANSIEDLTRAFYQLSLQDFRCPQISTINANLKKLIEQMIQFEPGKRITWKQLQAHQIFHKQTAIINGTGIQQGQVPQQQQKFRFASCNDDRNPPQQEQFHSQRENNYQNTQQIQQRAIQTKISPSKPAHISSITDYHDYLFAIFSFSKKAEEAFIEELKTNEYSLECLGLRLFALQFSIACLVDINFLFRPQPLVVNQKSYVLKGIVDQIAWKQQENYQSEVNSLIEKYQEQFQMLQNRTSKDEYLLEAIFTIYEDLKQQTDNSHYETHKYYKQYYDIAKITLQKENQNKYSLKVRYFAKKLNNLLDEFPIERAFEFTKQQIFIKIFPTAMYEAYLKQSNLAGK